MQRAVTVLALLVLGLVAPPAASRDAPPAATVRAGGTAFWDTESEHHGAVGPACPRTCRDFWLDVRGKGERLRIAADGDGTASPLLIVFDAEGAEEARSRGAYSAEAYLLDPAPGRYLVRVEHGRGAGVHFRLRAKLERVLPPEPTGRAPLLPNLQLVPPYEFTMGGCNAYEQVEYGARRCLRFSLGPSNVGRGPLVLEFPALSGLAVPEPVFQLVHHADGRVVRRQAGTSLYHKTHAHHHHNGFGSLELLRVLDPRRGRMQLAGTGPKQGFCMLDFMIGDWRAFANDEAHQQRQDCDLVNGATGTQIALGTGWADIYHWSLDGNYVEFGDNPDGLYVVRSVADANGDVLESDERDNAGYAYVRVRNGLVRVLERGHGTSPWDPRRRPADDVLVPNA